MSTTHVPHREMAAGPTTENSTMPSDSKKLRSREAWSVAPARNVTTGTGSSVMPLLTYSVDAAPLAAFGSRHACVTFSSQLLSVSWLGFFSVMALADQKRCTTSRSSSE